MALGIGIWVGTTSNGVYIHKELKFDQRGELAWLTLYVCHNLKRYGVGDVHQMTCLWTYTHLTIDVPWREALGV